MEGEGIEEEGCRFPFVGKCLDVLGSALLFIDIPREELEGEVDVRREEEVPVTDVVVEIDAEEADAEDSLMAAHKAFPITLAEVEPLGGEAVKEPSRFR